MLVKGRVSDVDEDQYLVDFDQKACEQPKSKDTETEYDPVYDLSEEDSDPEERARRRWEKQQLDEIRRGLWFM